MLLNEQENVIEWAQNAHRALEPSGAMSNDEVRSTAIETANYSLKERYWVIVAP